MKMNMEKTITEHCPHCTEVLFRKGRFKNEAFFRTRCPHCKKPVVVRVEKETQVTSEADNDTDASWSAV